MKRRAIGREIGEAANVAEINGDTVERLSSDRRAFHELRGNSSKKREEYRLGLNDRQIDDCYDHWTHVGSKRYSSVSALLRSFSHASVLSLTKSSKLLAYFSIRFSKLSKMLPDTLKIYKIPIRPQCDKLSHPSIGRSTNLVFLRIKSLI